MTDRNVVIRLRGEISDFSAKMVAASKSIRDVGDKMTGASKESQKFRQGLDSLGSAGAKVGLGAAAGLGAIVAVTAKFESAMSDVQAATHASSETLGALREAAIQAGADTAFSASEAAAGIENLAKAGVSSGDILKGGLQGALDLAAAGTIEVADAAETAATAMTQFGLEGKAVPHIADLLAAAAGKAQGEVSDMAYALKQSGLVANQMGLSIEETTGALASFASAGLLGSDAGTSFKTMLMRLLPQTEEAGDAMEAIGFSAFDAQGNMKSLTDIAGGLRQGLKDMSAEQRQATLATIFGQDAIRAATVLYEQGATGIQKWIDKVNDQGYAAETAAIKLDNLKGDVEALKGSLETMLIGLGEGSQGGLRGLTQGATDAVNAFNGLPDAMKGAGTQMLALTAITGGGLWFGSKVVGGISDARVALENLTGSSEGATRAMSRVGTALKIGATIEALYLLDETMDEVFNTKLDETNLSRSLDALAQGRIQGEVLSQFGSDLEHFGGQAYLATSNMEALQRAAMKIPAIGGFLSGPTGDAVENMERMDQALAHMVEAGQGDAAAKIFTRLQTAAKAAGVSTSDFRHLFEQYGIAVDNAAEDSYDFSVAHRSANRALEETGGPAGRSARGIEGVGRAAGDAADAADDLTTAIDSLKAQLEGRQKNRAFEQSIDDLAERLKERRDLLKELADAESEAAHAGTKDERAAAAQRVKDLKAQLKDLKLTLDEGTQAGRDWNSALEDIALNALEAGQTMSGVDRVEYLNNARKDFIDLATKILGSKKEAKELADELGLLHQTKAEPKIKVDTKGPKDDVIAFRKWLETLPPATLSAQLQLIRSTGLKNDIGEKGDPRFDRGFSGGGYTGSYPVNDVAGVVHGREFVMDADLTARYRPLFEAIHKSRRVPGYRDGGYVATQSSTTNYYSSGMAIDYDRLAAAMSNVRPLYGDVKVYGDGSFRREIEADRRRAALDGRRPVA